MNKQPTERFSDRVNNYVRYRPSYPEMMIDTLIQQCALNPILRMAEIGSGTGILTRQLLDRQLRIVAVEPNASMRSYAEAQLSNRDGFISVAATAEATTLADSSVDAIVVGQAFHWFRRDEALREFRRILKPTGWLALVWNQRSLLQPFQQAYEALLRIHAPEYSQVGHMNLTDDDIASCFDASSYRQFRFDHAQVFDWESFLGRMKSSSYTPSDDTPEFEQLRGEAQKIFAANEQDGVITFAYDTQLYLGRLACAAE